jgi:hypothetical protein
MTASPISNEIGIHLRIRPPRRSSCCSFTRVMYAITTIFTIYLIRHISSSIQESAPKNWDKTELLCRPIKGPYLDACIPAYAKAIKSTDNHIGCMYSTRCPALVSRIVEDPLNDPYINNDTERWQVCGDKLEPISLGSCK